MPDHRSVARSAVKGIIRRDQHGRSGHILDDGGGFAGNILSEVARDQPGVRIVASTGGTTDHELDCFALVELLDRGSQRRRDQRYRDDKDGEQKYPECFRHALPPCNLAVLAGSYSRPRSHVKRFRGDI
jgi:hypothetical protein